MDMGWHERQRLESWNEAGDVRSASCWESAWHSAMCHVGAQVSIPLGKHTCWSHSCRMDSTCAATESCESSSWLAATRSFSPRHTSSMNVFVVWTKFQIEEVFQLQFENFSDWWKQTQLSCGIFLCWLWLWFEDGDCNVLQAPEITGLPWELQLCNVGKHQEKGQLCSNYLIAVWHPSDHSMITTWHQEVRFRSVTSLLFAA